MGRLSQLLLVTTLALGIAGPACAEGSPEELATSLEQAFERRDIDLYASLLAANFVYHSRCVTSPESEWLIYETRADELQIMREVFESSATIATRKDLFIGDDDARLLFDISAVFSERDVVVGAVESKGHLILRQAADSGDWFIRAWVETYTDERPMCGTGSPISWTNSRSYWLGQSPTGIYPLSFGQVKAQVVPGR